MMSNFDVLLWSSERVDDQLTVVLTYGDGKDVARLLKSQWQLPPVGFPSLVQLPHENTGFLWPSGPASVRPHPSSQNNSVPGRTTVCIELCQAPPFGPRTFGLVLSNP